MQFRPCSDASCRGRANATGDQPAIEVELGPLALVFRVNMRRVVVLVVHPDHDPKEDEMAGIAPTPSPAWAI